MRVLIRVRVVGKKARSNIRNILSSYCRLDLSPWFTPFAQYITFHSIYCMDSNLLSTCIISLAFLVGHSMKGGTMLVFSPLPHAYLTKCLAHSKCSKRVYGMSEWNKEEHVTGAVQAENTHARAAEDLSPGDWR